MNHELGGPFLYRRVELSWVVLTPFRELKDMKETVLWRLPPRWTGENHRKFRNGPETASTERRIRIVRQLRSPWERCRREEPIKSTHLLGRTLPWLEVGSLTVEYCFGTLPSRSTWVACPCPYCVRLRYGHATVRSTKQGARRDNKHFCCFRLYVCTWNVATQQPHFDLSGLVKFDSKDQPDICLFGFQEVCSTPLQRVFDFFFYDPWTVELTHLLSAYDFVRVTSCQDGKLEPNSNFDSMSSSFQVQVDSTGRHHSSCLCQTLASTLHKMQCWRLDSNRLLQHVGKSRGMASVSQSFGLKPLFSSLQGSKGATICTINLGNFNMSFINAHLAAHDYQLQLRVQVSSFSELVMVSKIPPFSGNCLGS